MNRKFPDCPTYTVKGKVTIEKQRDLSRDKDFLQLQYKAEVGV